MFPKIFDVQNEKVVINEHCLLIPELKAVVEFYEDPLPALSFLRYRYDPESPYRNLEEHVKDEYIMRDYRGDYTLEDEVMIEAMEKLEKLMMTPTYRYYLDNKELLEKLGRFAKETRITTGRDGNLSALLTQVRSVGKTLAEFKQMEKLAMMELSEQTGKTRGDKKLAYDQL